MLLLNTLVAICVGLLVANVVKPGHWSTQLRPHAEEGAHAAGKPDMLQLFLDNVPKSLFGPLTDNGKVIGVIFLAVAFGIALRRFAKRPLHTVKDFVDLGLETFVTILHWIIDLVPLAVFGIVASIIGTQGFGPFHALGAFIVAHTGVLLMGLGSVLGQLTTSVVIDLIWPTAAGPALWQVIAMVVVAVASVAVARIRPRRRRATSSSASSSASG